MEKSKHPENSSDPDGFLSEVTGESGATLQPHDEPWAKTIERISDTARVAEVREETWWYFLEVLPPKILKSGWFGFAEGEEALRIFWRSGSKYYCRQLTEAQSRRLSDLVGLPEVNQRY